MSLTETLTKMQGRISNILRLTTAVLAALAMVSCIYEDPQDETAVPEARTLLDISFRVPQMNAQTRAEGTEGSYEDGVGYENYLDIYNGGFSIYFFDYTDNTYITSFTPVAISGPDAGNKGEYKVQTLVTNEIAELNAFKIVVLANWPSYPDDFMKAGVTTIDDLCNGVTGEFDSQFDCLPGCDLDPDKGLMIPFYGIHSYTGVTIQKGKINTLAEPVALLRAMAKVEVVVDIDGVSLSTIGIRGYNKKGYCAPDKVYTHGDYDHDGDWSNDYVKTPHLIGGENYPNQQDAFLPMFCRQRRDGAKKETWVAYVPEYRNTDSPDGTVNYKSRIELTLDIQEEGAMPYSIYFAKYDDTTTVKPVILDEKTEPNTCFDILRNNCYRFTVSIKGGLLIIKPEKWEYAYDNKFTFD